MFGQPLRHLENTDSTNDVALQWAQDGAPHGAVVRADSQSAGRGRQGRNWVSPRGCGLYFSLITRDDIALQNVPQLTMIAALAAARALEKIAPASTRAAVKWPNDIVLNEKKIGGVLCETRSRENAAPADAAHGEARAAFVVIGIGLNVNFARADLPPHTKIPASSLQIESGKVFDLNEVLAAVLHEIENAHREYSRGNWSELRREWMQRDFLQGRRVKVEGARETFRGVAVGVDENGLLRVSSEGKTRVVLAGDVTLDEN